MDDLSAIKCSGRCEFGIERWNGLLDHLDGIIRDISPVRWIELYNHDSQYADEGNEYDQTSSNNLGPFLYRDPGRTFFPRTSFRVDTFAFRPACRHELLSV